MFQFTHPYRVRHVDSINRSIFAIETHSEKTKNEIKELREDIKELIDKIEKSKKETNIEIEKIEESLKDKVSMNTLSKIQKVIIGIAALFAAIAAIEGYIIFFIGRLG